MSYKEQKLSLTLRNYWQIPIQEDSNGECTMYKSLQIIAQKISNYTSEH